ncbi:hypothetical protein GPK34_00485 [Secundilactobacillus kimchicus]|uniref:hypothetical protein n=1 Tax=Secundilactobacillus kimchicus TaxID=528209 RepID=UPI001C00E9D8|nr:hypothetical protein [Secundilactobacillus kimchicus]MBT9670514.1 hypothetical protein [Secundilactobacillus kimchicus]
MAETLNDLLNKFNSAPIAPTDPIVNALPVINSLVALVPEIGKVAVDSQGALHPEADNTVTGQTTFSKNPLGADGTYLVTNKVFTDAVKTLATDSSVLHKATDETITGKKTFQVVPVDNLGSEFATKALLSQLQTALNERVKTVTDNVNAIKQTLDNEVEEKLSKVITVDQMGSVDSLQTKDKTNAVNAINELAALVDRYYPMSSQAIPTTNNSYMNQALIYNTSQTDQSKLVREDNPYTLKFNVDYVGEDFSTNIAGTKLDGLKLTYGFKAIKINKGVSDAMVEIPFATTGEDKPTDGTFYTSVSDPIMLTPDNFAIGKQFELDFSGLGYAFTSTEKIAPVSPRLIITNNGDGTLAVQPEHGEYGAMDGSFVAWVFPYIKTITTYTVAQTTGKTLPVGYQYTLTNVGKNDSGHSFLGLPSTHFKVNLNDLSTGYSIDSLSNGIDIKLNVVGKMGAASRVERIINTQPTSTAGGNLNATSTTVSGNTTIVDVKISKDMLRIGEKVDFAIVVHNSVNGQLSDQADPVYTGGIHVEIITENILDLWVYDTISKALNYDGLYYWDPSIGPITIKGLVSNPSTKLEDDISSNGYMPHSGVGGFSNYFAKYSGETPAVIAI